jgi:hypothetical protein
MYVGDLYVLFVEFWFSVFVAYFAWFWGGIGWFWGGFGFVLAIFLGVWVLFCPKVEEHRG